MFKFRTNHRAQKAKRLEAELLPELTVFFEEFKKLSQSNPLFLFRMPAKLGGAR